MGQVTRAFGSSLEVVVRISVAEVHSGTLRMAPGMATVFMVILLMLLMMMMIFVARVFSLSLSLSLH